MKRFFKGLGRLLALIFIGALLYFIAATVYYRVTGDDSHSGMLGVKSALIYTIVLLTEGYIRRAKKLRETRRSNGGGTGGGLGGLGMTVYAFALLALFSVMLYYIVPVDSVLDDPLMYVFIVSAFLFIVFGAVFVIAWLAAIKRRGSAERNGAYARKIAELYGPYDSGDSVYYSDELYQNALCRLLFELFGGDCGIGGLFDEKTGTLVPDVTAGELIRRLDGDPRLIVNYGYITKSLYALRTEVNRLCDALGYGIRISARDIERERAVRDDGYSERRRADGRAASHDLSITDSVLREKGYRLLLLTGYFYDSDVLSEEGAQYGRDGCSEEELIYELDGEVTVREYITICPAKKLDEVLAKN